MREIIVVHIKYNITKIHFYMIFRKNFYALLLHFILLYLSLNHRNIKLATSSTHLRTSKKNKKIQGEYECHIF
jgi:hypothetical protein